MIHELESTGTHQCGVLELCELGVIVENLGGVVNPDEVDAVHVHARKAILERLLANAFGVVIRGAFANSLLQGFTNSLLTPQHFIF